MSSCPARIPLSVVVAVGCLTLPLQDLHAAQIVALEVHGDDSIGDTSMTSPPEEARALLLDPLDTGSREATTHEPVQVALETDVADGSSGRPLWTTELPSDPDWMFAVGRSDIGDPRLEYLEASTSARVSLRRQLWAESHGDPRGDRNRLEGATVCAVHRGVEGATTILVGLAVDDISPHASFAELSEEVSPALHDIRGAPLWLTELPRIPGVLFGLGVGGTEEDAEDLAWVDLGNAMASEIAWTQEKIPEKYPVDDAGEAVGTPRREQVLQQNSESRAASPAGCPEVEHGVLARWRDPKTRWYHCLVAAPTGQTDALAACVLGDREAAGRLVEEWHDRLAELRARADHVEAARVFREMLLAYRRLQHDVRLLFITEFDYAASDDEIGTRGYTLQEYVLGPAGPVECVVPIRFDGDSRKGAPLPAYPTALHGQIRCSELGVDGLPDVLSALPLQSEIRRFLRSQPDD